MAGWLRVALLAGLLVACQAGSGVDRWGIDTLVNYPPGQGRKEVPVQANDDGSPQPIALRCQCSDADPRGELSQVVTFDCFHQRHFGKCGETYMFDANAELAPEGFCQISCSRCNCCQSAYEVLQQLGATRFLQALEAGQPSLKELLQHPGFTGTLLAPTNQAFDAALARHGALLQDPTLLQQVLKFHVVPPEPVRRGLWTSPMLSLGPKLYPLYDGPQTLNVPRFALPANVSWEGGITGFAVDGPHNSARVQQSDVPACKAYVNLIDAVLLPFDPASPPAPGTYAAAAMLGAQGCGVTPNSLIAGQEVKAGDANRQATVGACCASCAATPGCNAWRYCSQKGGCRTPDRTRLKYGHCALLRSAEVASGRAPNYQDFSTVTVPLISGYLVADGTTAAPTATAVPPQGAPAAAASPTSQLATSLGWQQQQQQPPQQPQQEPPVQAAAGGAGRRLFRM